MKKGVKIAIYIGAAFLFLCILTMGILSLTLEKPTVSEYEKRELAKMPEFSFSALFSGQYTRDLTLFFADTFPFRERFVILGSYLKSAFGIPYDEVKIYSGAQAVEEEPPASSTPETSSSSTPEPSSSSVQEVSSSTPEVSSSASVPSSSQSEADAGEGYMIGYNFVYKNMALTPFGGWDGAAQYYAEIINRYHAALGDSVQIYDLIVPTHIAFALPDKYRSISGDQKRNIDVAYEALDPAIKAVDAYGALLAHQDEYTYFNTDHHWTSLGAYYAYTAFAEQAGFTPMSLSSFEKRTLNDYLGSLYSQTQDAGLRSNPDHVDYYIFPTQYKTWLYYKDQPYTPYATTLYDESARGGNSYCVFLHGDFPLEVVRTDIHNGRKILVVKESFGNAFSPFLVNHYEEVYVVDQRYFQLGLIDFIRQNGINELLFVNNVFAVNTQYHLDCIDNLRYQQYVPAEQQTEIIIEEEDDEEDED